ncbi:unnamed protein product, partial [Effrenium voratum]
VTVVRAGGICFCGCNQRRGDGGRMPVHRGGMRAGGICFCGCYQRRELEAAWWDLVHKGAAIP